MLAKAALLPKGLRLLAVPTQFSFEFHAFQILLSFFRARYRFSRSKAVRAGNASRLCCAHRRIAATGPVTPARFRLLAHSTEPIGRTVEASPPRAMRLLPICKAIQPLYSKFSCPTGRFMPHRRLGFATIAMCTILLFARIPIVLMIIAAEAP
jgi:hypothetical protein